MKILLKMNTHTQELPDYIVLLHLYQQHIEQARKLTSNIQEYRKHISIGIACLRSIITLADIPIKINIFTCYQLVLVLIHETNEYQLANQIIQHALILARSRDSLAPFKFALSEALIYIQLADPRITFRQINKQIERCTQLTLKNQIVDPRYVSWYYRYQFLLCQISYQRFQDYPTSLSALRNMINLSEQRMDKELWIVCKIHEIKLRIDRSEWNLVGQIFNSIIPLLDLPISTAQPQEQDLPSTTTNRHVIVIGQQIKNYTMLLFIVYSSIIGQSETSKLWLKHLRNQMDSPTREEGEDEGIYKIHLQSNFTQHYNDPSSSRKRMLEDDGFKPISRPVITNPITIENQYLMVSIMPRDLFYTLLYLVSLTVHFDGHGKSPKSLIYAHEGLKQIDRQLITGFKNLHYNKTDQLQNRLDYKPSPIFKINSYLKILGNIKLEIKILIVQISIVRSDFIYADQLLVEVIKTVCDSQQWNEYSPRLTFLKSMLSHATGNLSSARQSLLTSLFLVDQQIKQQDQNVKIRIGLMTELSTLSKACYVLLRLADSDASSQLHQSSSTSCSSMDIFRSFAVDKLILDLSELSKISLPNINMIIQVVLAISCGEIVKAKHHLTSALNEANKTSNTHLKMILLGLLSTMFFNTRNDQATKMLKSCYKLSLGFSPSHSQPQQQVVDNRQLGHQNPLQLSTLGHQNSQFNDIVVGNSSLGLCVGRKLVEIYESQYSSVGGHEIDTKKFETDRQSNQIRKDKLIASNHAHQRVLNQTPLL
ncbi:hypothetical protein PSHT_07095 [Puccinia striiformis]|uniref:Uncharacterized protein n=2 Tax=Puccinia striiformis TaxID=27350 RepID=A0A2S4VUZ8_9BASI|nr:hypothetical protein PSTT_03802 [Puccinia striiformis]POW15394.1 hypothetical protein PSHT_07095 [Puccinia striiformis]